MAKKSGALYVCSNCGATSQRWVGKCAACGEWNTYEEQITASIAAEAVSKGQRLKVYDSAQAEVAARSRIVTNLADMDAVLGGGLVAGSVTLIAGQPGIGKSTLLTQLSYNVAKKYRVLYVSGEESPEQVGMRASRLGALQENLKLASSTVANDIAATVHSGDYDLVIVDSIQTVACLEISSNAGSVSQITSSAQLLMSAAKSSSTALILVGHVTKEGTIAGPKVLEHLVDVVLQLDGERYGSFKVLRASKNRYGSTNEVSILEMTDSGLQEVANPSETLLSERQASDGSIVLATMEGTRPLLVEIQALVNKTSFGYPKRAAVGFELNRLNLLIAMLEKRTKLNLADKDVYINVVGGMRISEPAADLAVCMAIASADKGMQLNKNAVVFGEIGLSGEVRHVPFVEKRVEEAKKLGFDVVIGPKNTGTSKKLPLYSATADVRSALNTFLAK